MTRTIMGATALIGVYCGSVVYCALGLIELVLPTELSQQFKMGVVLSHRMILLAPIFSILYGVVVTVVDILMHREIKARGTWVLVLLVWLFNILGVFLYWWYVPKRNKAIGRKQSNAGAEPVGQ